MQTLTELVYRLAPPGGLFTTTVLLNLFPEHKAGARKLMLLRAVERGEVIRLKPGVYCLAPEFRRESPHAFVIAGMLYGQSYVSLESALGYYGLIPEAVYQVVSVSSRRAQRFHTPLGDFVFERVPSNVLLYGVKSIEVQKNGWAYIAAPLRAIADLVYLRKVDWNKEGLAFLTESMRIEYEDLKEIEVSYLEEIVSTFHSRRVRRYLEFMAKELKK